MKMGKWTIVRVDKTIIKQYGENQSIGYIINDDNFWNNNLSNNIHAIQYTGNELDFDQVEYNDRSPNSKFNGNIKIFADEWDKAHLKNLQNIWDNNNIYESIPNLNITPENPLPFIRVKKEETLEQKELRIGSRPTIYNSLDIY